MESIFAQLETLALPDMVKDQDAFLPSPLSTELLVTRGANDSFSFDSLPNLTALYRGIVAATTDTHKLSANRIVYEVMCVGDPRIQVHSITARIAALDKFKERLALDLVERGLFKQYGLDALGTKVQDLQLQLTKDCTDIIMSTVMMTYLAHCAGRNIVLLDVDACDRAASKTTFEINIVFVKQGLQTVRLTDVNTLHELDAYTRLCATTHKKNITPQKLATFTGMRGRPKDRGSMLRLKT